MSINLSSLDITVASYLHYDWCVLHWCWV